VRASCGDPPTCQPCLGNTYVSIVASRWRPTCRPLTDARATSLLAPLVVTPQP